MFSTANPAFLLPLLASLATASVLERRADGLYGSNIKYSSAYDQANDDGKS